MVTTGALSWVAKVERAARAHRKVDDLNRGFERAGRNATAANEATADVERNAGQSAQAAERAHRSIGRMLGKMSLLRRGLGYLRGSASKTTGRLGRLSSVTSRASGALGRLASGARALVGLVSGVSASAVATAAAIGAIIVVGSLLVFRLTEMVRTGAGPWSVLPRWARDAYAGLIGLISWPAVVLGAFLDGFLRGTLQGGLIEGIRRGVQQAAVEWVRLRMAWRRTLNRISVFVLNAWRAIKAGAIAFLLNLKAEAINRWASIKAGIIQRATTLKTEAITAVRDLTSGAIGLLVGLATEAVAAAETTKTDLLAGLRRRVGGLEDVLGSTWKAAAGGVVDAFNRLLAWADVTPPAPTVPTSTAIGGGALSVGGLALALPQLQSGGIIEESGVAAVHAGEAVLPADVTETMSEPSRPAAGSGGRERVIELVKVAIPDGELSDIQTPLTTYDMGRIADRVADAVMEEMPPKAEAIRN